MVDGRYGQTGVNVQPPVTVDSKRGHEPAPTRLHLYWGTFVLGIRWTSQDVTILIALVIYY